jgi:hypothetical protein
MSEKETKTTTITIDAEAVLQEIEESFSVAGTDVVDVAVKYLEKELKQA